MTNKDNLVTCRTNNPFPFAPGLFPGTRGPHSCVYAGKTEVIDDEGKPQGVYIREIKSDPIHSNELVFPSVRAHAWQTKQQMLETGGCSHLHLDMLPRLVYVDQGNLDGLLSYVFRSSRPELTMKGNGTISCSCWMPSIGPNNEIMLRNITWFQLDEDGPHLSLDNSSHFFDQKQDGKWQRDTKTTAKVCVKEEGIYRRVEFSPIRSSGSTGELSVVFGLTYINYELEKLFSEIEKLILKTLSQNGFVPPDLLHNLIDPYMYIRAEKRK